MACPILQYFVRELQCSKSTCITQYVLVPIVTGGDCWAVVRELREGLWLGKRKTTERKRVMFWRPFRLISDGIVVDDDTRVFLLIL